MNFKIKNFKKIFLSIFLIFLSLIGFGVLYTIFSPNPVVFLLRKNFGGEPKIVNVKDYEEIKKNVEILKDLSYPSKFAKNKYDIYLPKNNTKKLKVIIWVHGGSFVAGSKDGIENYSVMLANEGYAVVGVDYEWAPEIKYPGQVFQVEECIEELKNVKNKYNLDMDNVILFGDSAGAHIVSQVALLSTNENYEKELNVKSNINSNQIKGIVLYCGPFNVEKMLNTGKFKLDFFSSRIGWALFGEKNWKSSSLLKTTTIKDYVNEKFPKTFITDGNFGSFESQGKELAKEIESKGVFVKTLFFEKEKYGEIPHEYQFNIGDESAGSICYKNTLEFLKSLD